MPVKDGLQVLWTADAIPSQIPGKDFVLGAESAFFAMYGTVVRTLNTADISVLIESLNVSLSGQHWLEGTEVIEKDDSEAEVFERQGNLVIPILATVANGRYAGFEMWFGDHPSSANRRALYVRRVPRK